MNLVPATRGMVPALLARVDAARLSEMRASMGGDPETVIADSLDRSAYTWCGTDDQGPIWIGGVEPMQDKPGTGYVWQVLSPLLAQNQAAYLKGSRAVLGPIHALYPTVYALIDAKNDAALRHVCRMGGTVGKVVMKGGIAMRLCERSIPNG